MSDIRRVIVDAEHHVVVERMARPVPKPDEARVRGVYSGVWGRLSLDGTVDLAVVIRSLSIEGGVATIGTGGGITALSRPEEEWDEIVLKAGPMLRAIGAGPPT